MASQNLCTTATIQNRKVCAWLRKTNDKFPPHDCASKDQSHLSTSHRMNWQLLFHNSWHFFLFRAHCQIKSPPLKHIGIHHGLIQFWPFHTRLDPFWSASLGRGSTLDPSLGTLVDPWSWGDAIFLQIRLRTSAPRQIRKSVSSTSNCSSC